MENIVLETLQYSTLPDIDDVSPIGEKDYEVLSEIREVMERHGYFDRFGIMLLHKHFDIGEEEMLVEHTDVTNRTLTLTVEPKTTPNERVIETQWRFKSTPKAITACELRCFYRTGHKRVHVKVGR